MNEKSASFRIVSALDSYCLEVIEKPLDERILFSSFRCLLVDNWIPQGALIKSRSIKIDCQELGHNDMVIKLLDAISFCLILKCSIKFWHDFA